MVLLGALPLAAGLLVLGLFSPGASDPPRSDPEIGPHDDDRRYQQLQVHLQRRPDDARAWVLKARLDLREQRLEQAAAGFERALQARSKVRDDPGVWVESAEALGLLQGGTLAGPPRQRVHQALALNPNHAAALDLAGSAAWEAGEYTLAARHWKRLLASIPEGSPRHVQLAQAIERAERRARFELPAMR